jgi:hypothetical protein
VRLFALAFLLSCAACTKDDIGEACPQLEVDDASGSADPTRTETEEVVEQNPAFPCDELVCIATDGIAGYCSKKCRTDAGCPEGFECRTVQEIGPFASEKFCAWKRCEQRTDCGNADDFCCVAVPNARAGEELKLCEFSKDGKCS